MAGAGCCRSAQTRRSFRKFLTAVFLSFCRLPPMQTYVTLQCNRVILRLTTFKRPAIAALRTAQPAYEQGKSQVLHSCTFFSCSSCLLPFSRIGFLRGHSSPPSPPLRCLHATAPLRRQQARPRLPSMALVLRGWGYPPYSQHTYSYIFSLTPTRTPHPCSL